MAGFGTSCTTSDPNQTTGKAGEAITQGFVVYLSGSEWKLAKASDTATLGMVGISEDMGVALTDGVDGGAVVVLRSGLLENCSGLLAGVPYFVDEDNAGEIVASNPTEDEDIACFVGLGKSTTSVYIRPINSGEIYNAAG